MSFLNFSQPIGISGLKGLYIIIYVVNHLDDSTCHLRNVFLNGFEDNIRVYLQMASRRIMSLGEHRKSFGVSTTDALSRMRSNIDLIF